MYEKCVECDRLGKDCIPNLYIMSADEIRDWARKIKDRFDNFEKREAHLKYIRRNG